MARTYNSGWREWFNTASADISQNFIVEGLVEQMQQLDALLASNPDMEKRMQNVIRKVLTKGATSDVEGHSERSRDEERPATRCQGCAQVGLSTAARW